MERAKQFMPFDALRGLREALKEKENVIVEKRLPTDDELDKLNNIFASLKKGDMVRVEYFKKINYVTKTGLIANINIVNRTIRVVDEVISFDDIISLVKI